jgi:hypothetical protein
MKAVLLLCLIAAPFFTSAQLHVVAANEKGMLFETKDHSQIKSMTQEDTLAVDKAKSITYLQVSDGSSRNVTGKYWIEHFEMTVFENSKAVSYKSSSEKLTDKMKKQLSKISPGSRIFFEYIRVKVNDGSTRSVPPLHYSVAEKK